MDQEFIKDDKVIKYLLKNEEIILRCFDVPEGETPTQFILKLSNKIYGNEENKDKKASKRKYCLKSLYATIQINCLICEGMLHIKKSVQTTLYDDVLGTTLITVITKYCKSCKFTYYPGYYENYHEKSTFFYPEWRNYGVFICTHSSAFSTDLLDRLICMKQKCHTTFLGKCQAYNLQHKYHKDGVDKAVDKRRIADAYYKYTFILYKERYNLPLEIKGTIDEALAADYSIMYEKFKERYSNHECDINGCKSVIVIDGHMKAHRKICKSKGCRNDPKYRSVLCENHSQTTTRNVDDNKQVLLNDEEYHIENIIRKSLNKKEGKWLYEVVWKNHTETTMEPKENIPRILVELYERYGDCTISTEIENFVEIGGIKYVNINVTGDIMCLPASSLEICENAYFTKIPTPDQCNTEKTKSLNDKGVTNRHFRHIRYIRLHIIHCKKSTNRHFQIFGILGIFGINSLNDKGLTNMHF